MKRFLVFFVLLFSTNNVYAKVPINIYQTPRTTPMERIYHESANRFELNSFKDNLTIVIFWSKKCAICIKELNSLDRFQSRVKDDRIKIVLISPSQEWDSVEQTRMFLKRFGASNLEVYWDEKGRLAASLGIFTTPHSVLINSKGEEIGRIRGKVDWDDNDTIKIINKIKSKHM